MIEKRTIWFNFLDKLKSAPLILFKKELGRVDIAYVNNQAITQFELSSDSIYDTDFDALLPHSEILMKLGISNLDFYSIDLGSRFVMLVWSDKSTYEKLEGYLSQEQYNFGFWYSDFENHRFELVYEHKASSIEPVGRDGEHCTLNEKIGMDIIRSMKSDHGACYGSSWFYFDGKPEKTYLELIEQNGGNMYFGVYNSMSSRNIDDVKNAAFELREATTNLPNINYYDVVFRHQMERVEGETKFVVMILRIRNLIGAFSIYGGDKVQQLYRKLQELIWNDISEEALMFYVCKSEFGLVIPFKRDDEAEEICQKICEYFETPWFYDKFIFYSNVYIGVSEFPKHGTSPHELIKKAEIAVGGIGFSAQNKYAYYTSSIKEEMENKLKLQGELKSAIDNDEFVMYLQAQVDIATKEVVGAELLLRWNHKDKGIVSPGSFLPVAEEMGSIYMIDQLVIQKAAMIQSELKQKGLGDIKLSLNLSAVTFNTASIDQDIIDIVEMYDADPTKLVIELTETMEILDDKRAHRILKSLHEHGFLFAIDDFGKGYSSLNYLVMLPFDEIKIDKLYVDQYLESLDIKFLVQKIVEISNHYGLDIVMEGIELEEQHKELKNELSEDIVLQGYLFHKPQPLESFVDFVKKSKERPPEDL